MTAIALRPEPISEVRLEIFDVVPPWAIVHAARDDRHAPLIQSGEIVIVESSGRAGRCPTDGNLFLIEHVSPPSGRERHERRTRSIVRVRKTERGWYASPSQRFARGVIYLDDGPYLDEQALADRLLGPVIGIYGPSQRECRNG